MFNKTEIVTGPSKRVIKYRVTHKKIEKILTLNSYKYASVVQTKQKFSYLMVRRDTTQIVPKVKYQSLLKFTNSFY